MVNKLGIIWHRKHVQIGKDQASQQPQLRENLQSRRESQQFQIFWLTNYFLIYDGRYEVK